MRLGSDEGQESTLCSDWGSAGPRWGFDMIRPNVCERLRGCWLWLCWRRLQRSHGVSREASPGLPHSTSVPLPCASVGVT